MNRMMMNDQTASNMHVETTKQDKENCVEWDTKAGDLL